MRIVCGFLLVVLCGCEKAVEKSVEIASGGEVKVDGGKVTIKTEEGQATFETKDGETAVYKSKEGTVAIGKNEVPKGFPLKTYPGSRVIHSMDARPDGKAHAQQIVTSVAAPADKVAAFYEKALKGKNLKTERSEMKMPQVQTVVILGKSDKVEATASIVKQADKNEVTATIVWSTKP